MEDCDINISCIVFAVCYTVFMKMFITYHSGLRMTVGYCMARCHLQLVHYGGARCHLQSGMVEQDATYSWVWWGKIPHTVGHGGATCPLQFDVMGQDATFIDLLPFSIKQEGSKVKI